MSRIIGLALVFALSASAGQGEETALKAVPQDLGCAAVSGTGSLLVPGTVVLAGEMHGTAESPAFVSDLVCVALERDLPVTVALEIYHQEEARIAAWLASDGGGEARAALLTGSFWDGEFQDGRRSAAKLALLDDLRGLRRRGLPVEVVLLDREEQTSGNERDAFMAGRLAAAAERRPGDVVVALVGNLHSRIRKGTPWDAEYTPMGLVLEEALGDRRVVGLNVAHGGGTAWFCNAPDPASCKPQEVPASASAEAAGKGGVVLDEALEEKGYEGWYAVGTLSASPPAAAGGGG